MWPSLLFAFFSTNTCVIIELLNPCYRKLMVKHSSICKNQGLNWNGTAEGSVFDSKLYRFPNPRLNYIELKRLVIQLFRLHWWWPVVKGQVKTSYSSSSSPFPEWHTDTSNQTEIKILWWGQISGRWGHIYKTAFQVWENDTNGAGLSKFRDAEFLPKKTCFSWWVEGQMIHASKFV